MSASTTEIAIKKTIRILIIRSCFLSSIFLITFPFRKSSVSVELEVKTREESVDMEADNTSMTTIPIRISDSFESMNGMMLS